MLILKETARLSTAPSRIPNYKEALRLSEVICISDVTESASCLTVNPSSCKVIAYFHHGDARFFTFS
jgi:hypothetical protein